MPLTDKLEIAKNWLPRYTGTALDKFGDYILLTNFGYYVNNFAEMFNCDIYGEDKPMQVATNSEGLSIINFGMGSPNAATIMDLLIAIKPKGVLFLGKCCSYFICILLKSLQWGKCYRATIYYAIYIYMFKPVFPSGTDRSRTLR